MNFLDKVIIALFSSFIFFVLLTFFFGPAGYFEQKKVESVIADLEKNVEQLNSINIELQNHYKQMVNDKEKSRLMARELGFYKKGEGSLNITGFKENSYDYDTGHIQNVDLVRQDNTTIIWIFSAVFAMLMFILQFVLEGYLYDHKKAVRELRSSNTPAAA